MAAPPPHDGDDPTPPRADPRLRIPDVLREAPPGAPRRETPSVSSGRRNVALEQLARVSVIGTNFALYVAIVGGIGWALERWVLPGARPWLLLAGLGVGLVLGGYRFWKDASAASAAATAQARRPGRDRKNA
ncbi:MAG: AtpZ/AtpI family protein [Phycisphaerales bacterium]